MFTTSGLEIVKLYTKAYTFVNGVERYRPIVT
jgi:hypothetical protein